MQLGIFKITYNRTAQPRCYHNAFYGDSFVNLGEEVILTLLWQSGTSESATVCFVISLSICYWLLKCRVFASCVCVCVRKREREREGHSAASCVCACVCVCVGGGRFLKAKAGDYGKGRYISGAAYGVRSITMHCASWPIRADCAYRKEGLCNKRSVWERRGIEDLQ